MKTTGYEWGSSLPVIRGERVALRPLKPVDAVGIFELFCDEEVMRYWSTPPMTRENEALELISVSEDLFQKREMFTGGVVELQEDRVFGTTTVLNLEPEHRRAELGIAISRTKWGHGYGREVLELIIGFCFRELDLHRLEADIDPDNTASLRLFERQGFKREGLLRERWYQMGEVQDAVFLGLLRNEWTADQVSK